MSNDKLLFLLSTSGCHLCGEATILCNELGIKYQSVDIVEDDNLVAAYGDKIPVAIAEGAEQALFWPFDREQLHLYVKAYGINKN